MLTTFDIFKIGIGPSSSHTMGPMLAAYMFSRECLTSGDVARVVCELYGSLALTGIGHCTDKAVLLGLEGSKPDTVDPKLIDETQERIKQDGKIKLFGTKIIPFNFKEDLLWFRRKSLPHHPNALRFRALDGTGSVLLEKTFYSVGGGRIFSEEEMVNPSLKKSTVSVPFVFKSAEELLQMCEEQKLTIAQLMYKNEESTLSTSAINEKLDRIWFEMNECIERGCKKEGILPGRLKVKRRAATIFKDLQKNLESNLQDPLTILDWVNLYALAVNEENASGSKIVTAPTNGASGIMPAVIRYYKRFCPGSNEQGIRNFLLTSSAVGILYATNASISGAEVGCQGEVGVACSMAAGGLVAALGGDNRRVEQAAEIGMEHNLGLTCDPIGGLVQIPCIERNAMGAIKAINASRIAMLSDGTHYVSLDSVIRTMRQTGADMMTKYKETSRGGLAVNVTEC